MSTETSKTQQQPQAENNTTGEMCDRIRNRGTMVDSVMIDRTALEVIIQDRINRVLIERFESMASTIMQWQYDNPISGLDPDVLNKVVVATSSELILEMLVAEVEKLKS